ncbi:hypothetical protein [Compostibacter hankyongensis]|uniref:DUF4212 domain-containing protein n=1 Tax=Compostibacter hankyongensis TaxID=1007089 RepID=A0ABP8FC11_9BACT
MGREQKGMDPELISQFKKIALSLLIWLGWLILNTFLGVVLDLGFFDNPGIPLWVHILFFVWYAAGFAAMIWITKVKIWHR